MSADLCIDCGVELRDGYEEVTGRCTICRWEREDAEEEQRAAEEARASEDEAE